MRWRIRGSSYVSKAFRMRNAPTTLHSLHLTAIALTDRPQLSRSRCKRCTSKSTRRFQRCRRFARSTCGLSGCQGGRRLVASRGVKTTSLEIGIALRHEPRHVPLGPHWELERGKWMGKVGTCELNSRELVLLLFFF